jgi:hypothetical protein
MYDFHVKAATDEALAEEIGDKLICESLRLGHTPAEFGDMLGAVGGLLWLHADANAEEMATAQSKAGLTL